MTRIISFFAALVFILVLPSLSPAADTSAEGPALLVDSTGELTAHDVIIGSARTRFRTKLTEPERGVEWQRWQVDEDTVGQFLLVPDMDTDSLELYYMHNGGIQKSGVHMSTPVSQRAVKDSYLSLEIPKEAAGSPSIWTRTTGDIGGIELDDRADVESSRLQRYAGSFSFSAFALTITALTLFLFLVLRDPAYGWYSLATAFLALWDLSYWGASWQFLWPNASVPYTPTVDALFFGYVIAIVAFSCCFLSLSYRSRWLLAFLTAITILLHLFFSAFQPNAPDIVTDGSESVWNLVLFLCLLGYGVRRLMEGYRPARFFVIGFAFLIALGVGDRLEHATDILPDIPILYWMAEMGIAINALALLAAIADAFLTARRDVEAANKSKEEAKQQLIDHQAAAIESLESYNEAFSRFVPRAFLAQINKSDIRKVELGDHAEREMTVLFSDIRSFTTMSEDMSPEKTFAFVNEYLDYVGPIVRKHGGFIDKFIGDAVMALFDGNVDPAIEAAIELQKEVKHFNQKRAHELQRPIAVGIGLHCGNLMLGTIGESERIDTTVIASAVNVASRIESLTKVYQVGILVSGEVLEKVTDRSKYHVRGLGNTTPRGTSHEVALYEVLDADEPEMLLKKIETRPLFDAAVAAMAMRDFETAAARFETIVQSSPADQTAAYLLQYARTAEATSQVS